VAEAERAGAETGNRAAGAERRLVDLGRVKGLQTIAGGIAKRNQPADAPGVGQRLRLGRDMNLMLFQSAASSSRPAASATSQPKKRAPSGMARSMTITLLAVVHPEGQQRGAALHRLQADQPGPELPPIVEIGRPEPAYPRACIGIAASVACKS